MSLADELNQIMKEEQQAKAEEARRIDSFFPQPEPHVLLLDENPAPAASKFISFLDLKM